MEEDTDLEELDMIHGHRAPDLQAQGDFFFGDGELDPLSADQLEAFPKFQVFIFIFSRFFHLRIMELVSIFQLRKGWVFTICGSSIVFPHLIVFLYKLSLTGMERRRKREVIHLLQPR